MFRTSAARSALRPLAKTNTPAACFPRPVTRFYTKETSSLRSAAYRGSSTTESVALTAYRRNTSLIRSYATIRGTTRDVEGERRAREMKLEPQPEAVSTASTMAPVIAEGKEEEVDMMAGIRHDMQVIRDTFALNEVPQEAYRIGLAGVLPYLATSAATVVCALELNDAAHHGGMGIIMSDQTAELLLQILEPLQVGYGAVILSFLGAIHWGLEWAKYGGVGGYKRYAIGVIAPAVAWPTILLPVEYALITQFLAFTLLYSVDSQTTVRGWTPPWYSTYRFMLTFIVGASIVLSLVARGQIVERSGSLPTAADRIKDFAWPAEAYNEEHREIAATDVEAKEAEDEDEE